MERIASIEEFPHSGKDVPVFLCIGNFDGVHRGHRALFDWAKTLAREQDGICGALTFSPHPEAFFRGDAASKLIYSQEVKLALFEKLGLDFAIMQRFSADFARLPAEDFFPRLKNAIPALTGVFVGKNFRFGAGRKGDAASLQASACSFGASVYALDPVLFENEKISSTRIREQLVQGKIEAADAMLAEPYFSTGTIVPGRQLGRTIGFPTLNLPWNPDLRPRFGVYAVRVKCGENVFRGVANYGVRPTVERGVVPEPLLETFVLEVPDGANCPSYGDVITVEWLKFLREERRFGSVAELREQLAEDLKIAESVFSDRLPLS